MFKDDYILTLLMDGKLTTAQSAELKKELDKYSALSVDTLITELHKDPKNPRWSYLLRSKDNPEGTVPVDVKADCYIALAAFCFAKNKSVKGTYKGVQKIAEEARDYAKRHPECAIALCNAFSPPTRAAVYKNKVDAEKLAQEGKFGGWVAFKLTEHNFDPGPYRTAWLEISAKKIDGPSAVDIVAGEAQEGRSSLGSYSPDFSERISPLPDSAYDQSSYRGSMADLSLAGESEFAARKTKIEEWKKIQLQMIEAEKQDFGGQEKSQKIKKALRDVISKVSEIQTTEIDFQENLEAVKSILNKYIEKLDFSQSNRQFLQQYLEELDHVLAASRDFSIDKWINEDCTSPSWQDMLQYLSSQIINPSFQAEADAAHQYNFKEYAGSLWHLGKGEATRLKSMKDSMQQQLGWDSAFNM